MSRESDLLPILDPPSGGLSRLRVKRDDAERSHHGWQMGRAVYGAALAGGAFALLLLLPGGQLPATHAADRLLGVRSQGESVRSMDVSTVVQALPSQQPGVRLYWAENMQAGGSDLPQ